jgi:hypothetical protein
MMMEYLIYVLILLLLFNIALNIILLLRKEEVSLLDDRELLIKPFLAVQILVQHFQEINCLEGEVSARSCGQRLFEKESIDG